MMMQIIEFPVVLLQWRRRPASNASDSDDSLTSPSSASSMSNSTQSSEELQTPTDSARKQGQWELVVVDEFRRFVKPTWRPTLSAFCTELTGIKQSDIDDASTFTEVLEEFCFEFMQKHGLFTRQNATTWVTDGPWVCIERARSGQK